ncbi:MAG TPA: phosphatase PAP2 family protein [Chitinophagales bacterium]|nr:phosphatase PAP2 family protein [Chitinophagales bacterium]
MFRSIQWIAATVIAFTISACALDVPGYLDITPYTYSSVDSTGGEWEPVYVHGADLVSIPTPESVTSDAYLTEIEELKSIANNLTSEQSNAIEYWGNNTTIRWIEITEELIAKYNLAPSPDENGEYGVPDQVFPATYPQFPFAHPPYASRAYAYLSAAIYDALIATWEYKYTYDRRAPYMVDETISPAYPKTSIPSYPAEDAVIASVAEDVLEFLFPLETAYISNMAYDCRNSRKWASMNVQSDIDAGDSLGHALADIFIGRAKTDSMKFAQVLQEEYDEMEAAANALWSWPNWENLEVPQRPIGITPKFGHVVPWWVDDITTVRPGPPPAIGSEAYETARQELLDFSKDLTDEQERIAYFWGDGFGTYTPAGHWNTIAKEPIIDHAYNPLRTARVFAYLNTTMMDAGISCWDTKYYYMYPRPPQADPEIKTLFGLPNFPSYTSGHSTFSAAAATVLSYMFPENEVLYNQYMYEASESRIYSRIHFRFDCEAGLTAGTTIGNLAVDAAKADGSE